MSQPGQFENAIIVISDEESSGDNMLTEKTPSMFSNKRLRFNWPSDQEHRNGRLGSCRSPEELPDLTDLPRVTRSTPPSGEREKVGIQPAKEATRKALLLKRLTIPLVRCDHLLKLQETASEPKKKAIAINTYLETARDTANCIETSILNSDLSSEFSCSVSNKTHAAERFKTDFFESPLTGEYDNPENMTTLFEKNVLESEEKNEIEIKSVRRVKAKEIQESEKGTLVFGNKSELRGCPAFPRRRITEERQAVSSPVSCKAPLISFHQPAPNRQHIPNTRISCHRQAFSSPLRSTETNQSEPDPPPFPELLNLPHDFGTLRINKPEDIVQIFHRTVKRKTNIFDQYGDLNGPSFLNQMLNLERNYIFGPYWHVYVPFCNLPRAKMPFTEYHDAFVETTLEQDEGSVEEALSFLKDFKSNRRPTYQCIAKIMDAWKNRNLGRGIQDLNNSICTLVEVLQNYPEVASACADGMLIPLFSSDDAEDPQCSIFMASLELDLFTRTLCNAQTRRRSLSYSLLSIDKNYGTVKAIVQLLGVNIASYSVAHKRPAKNEPSAERCYANRIKKISKETNLIDSICGSQSLYKSLPLEKETTFSNSELESTSVTHTTESKAVAADTLLAKEQDSVTAVTNLKMTRNIFDQLNIDGVNVKTAEDETGSVSSETPFDLCSFTELWAENDRDVIEENASWTIEEILNKIAALLEPDSEPEPAPKICESDPDVEQPVLTHSQIQRIFQLQHLLAMSLESSLWQMEMVVCQIAGMLCQTYLSLTELHQRRLLLGSLSSPLLTRALCERLLVEKGFLTVHHWDKTGDRADTQRTDIWRLNFNSAVEFLKSYTAVQQEEFAFLFYYMVWGTIETSKHRIEESRRDRLLNLGLAPSRIPRHMHQCVRHMMALSPELSAHVGATMRQFLDLTNCLLQAVPAWS